MNPRRTKSYEYWFPQWQVSAQVLLHVCMQMHAKKYLRARSHSLTTCHVQLLLGATSLFIFSMGRCDYEAFVMGPRVIKGVQCLQKKGSWWALYWNGKLRWLWFPIDFPSCLCKDHADLLQSVALDGSSALSCSHPLTHFMLDQSGSSCRLKTLRAHWLNEELSEL